MPWPSLIDADPNRARIVMECVLTLTPTSGNITNPMLPAITAAVVAATGVTPKSVVVSAGNAIVTMPPDRQLWDFIGGVLSAAAASGVTGTVTGYEQGRVLP